jgi:hypothetical protein
MKKLELIALMTLLTGIGLTIAVWWFMWDFLVYWQFFTDPNKTKDFCFWLPFYVSCIPYSHWSLIFDTLFALAMIATFILIPIGAYLIGYTRE